MIDQTISMFGTVNLDMRSLYINYEVSLFVYDSGFAKQLGALQQTYKVDSDKIDAAEWGARGFRQRFAEDTMRLLSPLL